jgi:hypothetical protein
LGSDLTALEQHRFLFRIQNVNTVIINSSSNFAELSVSLGTAPLDHVAVSGLATGSVVADAVFGAHSMSQISGSTSLLPKNLALVIDAYTGDSLTDTDGREIFGLVQVETGAVNGDAFNDVSVRSQVSFIKAVNSSTIEPATIAGIGGKHILFQYPHRTALESIPDDAYLRDTIFVDVISGSAALDDITLQRAIDNQVGTVDQDKNVSIDIGAGFAWTYLSGTSELWKLISDDVSDQLQISVDQYHVTSSNASFSDNLVIDRDGTQVTVGGGAVTTLSGSDLNLTAGAQLQFSDFFGGPIALTTGSAEWTTFYDLFGPDTTILGAFNELSASLNDITPSGSLSRQVWAAGATVKINANVNATFPTNLDAALGDYSDADFARDHNWYLNGVRLLPGTDATNSNDIYPGDSPASGDVKFPYNVRSGSIITQEKFLGTLPVS